MTLPLSDPLLCSNAAYHACDETLRHLAFLGMEVIFSGPYSYSTAPCELLFAHFKRGELNPALLPTGKKNLTEVKARVIAKAKTIRPANVMMFWHHCLSQLYRYLVFEPN